MSQAARAIEWEVDDAAPTRLRWEEVQSVPSDMEATRHIRLAPLPTPSDMEATRHIRVDRLGLAAMKVKEPEDTPIPLARRRDSTPPISDIRMRHDRSDDRDSFPPPEVAASSAEITLVGPPPSSWVEVDRVEPMPLSYVPAMSIRPFTPSQPAPFRLLFIALVAFAFTLGMFLALTANELLAVLG